MGNCDHPRQGDIGYDGLGARVSKQSGPTQFHYMRDGVDVLSPILHDGTSGYSPGVGMKTGTTVRAFASDRLGTHTNEVSSSGVTATREYDAFGNLLNPPRQGASPYGYAGDWGYLEDDESGFKQVGFRVYDPSAGRFLTMDTGKVGRNWMAYCESRPTRSVDPLGQALVELYTWNVAAGLNHCRIVVTDNVPGSPTYGRRYVVEGNPERNSSGEVVSGGYGNIRIDESYEKPGSPNHGKRWRVEANDKTPFTTAVGRFHKSANALRKHPVGYHPVSGPNSNTVARKLIRLIGFEDPFITKDDPPMTGWSQDPWVGPLPFPLFYWDRR